MKNIISGALLTLLLTLPAVAQSYSIPWHKIAGGGGASGNSQYALSGTIGQHDAGGPLTGGTFSLTGGFWARYALQTPGAPLLTIRPNGPNSLIISWPSPSTGFNLQQNSDLSTTHWTTPPEGVTDNGTIKFIIVSPPTGNLYFRLKQ